MRLDVVDARRRQPIRLAPCLLRRRDVDAAEPLLHCAAGTARDPRPAHQDARADDRPLVDAIAEAQAGRQRRSEIDHGGDTGHQQLLRGNLHHPCQHRVATVALDPRKPGVVAALAQDDQVAVRLDQTRQHDAATGVDDGRLGRDRGLRCAAGNGDLAAFDHDRGMVNRRDVVAVINAADQGEGLRTLRPAARMP